jgi:hypothetical protein
MYDVRNPQRDFNYEAILSFNDGRPTLRVPALGLIASGATLEAAHAEMERLKAEYLEKARAADLLDTLPPPTRIEGGRASATAAATGATIVKGDLRSFLAKLAIVCVVVVALFGAASVAIRSSLHVPVGKQFWAKAESELHRAAQGPGMSPEDQARAIADIRVLVARYKPFVDELRPLLSDQPPPPGAESK